MKILLIQPPHNLGKLPPLGILYLASYLEKFGHQTDVLDMAVEKVSLTDYLIKKKPDVAGISISTPFFMQGLDVAKEIKKNNIPVIVGGSHPSVRPEDFTSLVDQVVIGEGETQIIDTIKKLEEGKVLDKIVKGVAVGELDTIPPPALYKITLNKYDVPGVVMTSRGCPWNCTFCWHLERKWRPHSPQRVVEELSYLSSKGIRYVQWLDDNAFLKKDRVMKICDLVRKKRLRFTIQTSMRVDLADKEILKNMFDIGLRTVHLGVESANDDILERTKKKITLSRVKEAIKIAKDVGLAVNLYFIIGLPGSTLETTKKDINFVLSSGADNVLAQPLTPYPGTEIYDWALKEARKIAKDWYFFGHGEQDALRFIPFDTPRFTRDERIKAVQMWQQAKKDLAWRNRLKKLKNPKNYPRMAFNLIYYHILKKINFRKKDIRYNIWKKVNHEGTNC